MNYLLLILIFFAGLILGIFLSRIQKPKKIGTLILNVNDRNKPFFELHFSQDPDELKSGVNVLFTLEIH